MHNEGEAARPSGGANTCGQYAAAYTGGPHRAQPVSAHQDRRAEVHYEPAKSAAVPSASTELLDVGAVAGILSCSTRHVYRLTETGRMPASVKLGALVRWPRRAVLDWIAAGCPAARGIDGGTHEQGVTSHE